MFFFNGWIKIIESTLEVDDGHLNEIMTQLQEYTDQVSWHNAFIDLREPNGYPVLSIHGCNNHKFGGYSTGNYDRLLDIFRLVGKIAPGSWGLLYVQDDEEVGYQNECQVFVLKRGILEKVRDPFFSPLIPTVEDSYPTSD